MKITAIDSLAHQPDLFRISVDNRPLGYISAADILSLGLIKNQDISKDSYIDLVQLVKYTSFYSQALKYADRRLRSKSEVNQYLKLKGCDVVNRDKITKRLENVGIINETKFAQAYVHDQLMTKPMAQRTLKMKLKQKKIMEEVIDAAVDEANIDDQANLDSLIAKKRHLSAYVNNQPRLFAYLLRQGFSFSDIAKRIGLPKQPKRL